MTDVLRKKVEVDNETEKKKGEERSVWVIHGKEEDTVAVGIAEGI